MDEFSVIVTILYYCSINFDLAPPVQCYNLKTRGNIMLKPESNFEPVLFVLLQAMIQK